MGLNKRYLYVITLAESGSFSQAAKKLYMAQSSLSQFVKNLENELGVVLFLRNSPLQLTDAGKKFLQTAYEIQYLENQLTQQLQPLQPVKKGVIKIGITRYWGGLLLPRILPEFQRRYPDIELKIIEGRTVEIVEKLSKLDIAFFTPPNNFNDQAADCEKILKEEIKVAVQPDFLAQNFQSSNVLPNKVICDLPLILLHRGQKLRQVADDILKKQGKTPEILMETENITTAYKLASGGLAATFVPERINELTPPFKRVALYQLESPVYWELCSFCTREKRQQESLAFLVMLAKRAFV